MLRLRSCYRSIDDVGSVLTGDRRRAPQGALRQIASIGIVSETAPHADESLRLRDGLQDQIRAVLGRALCIRHIDVLHQISRFRMNVGA